MKDYLAGFFATVSIGLASFAVVNIDSTITGHAVPVYGSFNHAAVIEVDRVTYSPLNNCHVSASNFYQYDFLCLYMKNIETTVGE